MTRVRNKCYTNGTTATRVKNFDLITTGEKHVFTSLYSLYLLYGK